MTNDRDSDVSDVENLMRDHFIRYASYVICDRAIPNIVDGLKPVQRRILHTLFRIHDNKFHKVANVVGQSMALHPHGDAPIYEALVNLANKGYLLDTQGNFGNIYTGDPAAAARYIETRLSPLASQLFNADLTQFVPSYDGRNFEPVVLPAKIPLLLMQGAEGIAVGMATRIFPHNFKELLQAEIAILQQRSFKVYPDFLTGGIMDVSEYNKGKGKIRLRAKIVEKDPKTLVIKEICYGTTTESVIQSIDDAARKGKIKIDSIDDYTAQTVEIEIKLPRGQYANAVIDLLYAYTECQVSLSSQMIVIKETMPCEMDVHEILRYHVDLLLKYLKQELEIEIKALEEKIFQKTLEQIFIENRLYKHIEEVAEFEEVFDVLVSSFKPFVKLLYRAIERQDYERLLHIPIRRIAKFDIKQNQGEIRAAQEELVRVRQYLKNLTEYAINYLQGLLEKYAKQFPRKTKIETIEEIDKRAMETKEIMVAFDPKNGFVGTKVEGSKKISCTNFDKLLLLYKNGEYKVINIPEKLYVKQEGDVAYVGVADKKTLFSVCYKDSKGLSYAKRFIVKQFILEKSYRYLPEGAKLQFLSDQPAVSVTLHFGPKARKKTLSLNFTTVPEKGATSRGVRVAATPVVEVKE